MLLGFGCCVLLGDDLRLWSELPVISAWRKTSNGVVLWDAESEFYSIRKNSTIKSASSSRH